MRVIVAPTSSSSAKAQAVADHFAELFRSARSVLDVGCRGSELRDGVRAVGGDGTYVGVDIAGNADVIGNVERGLPFRDGDFDVVVALDVLEHVDDIHRAARELGRISRRAVIISLPNLYDIKYRLNHLMGRPLSAKYGLPPDPPGDRHRWFFSLVEARQFVSAFCEGEGYSLACEVGVVGPRRARVARSLAAVAPNVLAPTYLVGVNVGPLRKDAGCADSGRAASPQQRFGTGEGAE